MEKNKKRVFTVLSIDGGGVRGIVAARLLQEVEERTGKPVAKLFDLVGGASTGAIIGGGLVVPDENDPSKPRFSAKDILSFYHHAAPRIFPEISFKVLQKISKGALYDPRPLESILENRFGDLKMKDMLTSLIVPATDIKNFKPVWITHLKGQKDNSEEGWDSMLVRDAVRATTSAPTLFPAKYYETTPNEDMPNVKHRHALIDGGFFGGNTIRHLMTQAKKMAPPDAEIVIVHVSTGTVRNSLSPEEYNALGSVGLVTKGNGSFLMSLVMDLAVIDTQNDVKGEIGDRFFAFDGIIDPEENPDAPSTSMDDARPENLQRLEKLAEKIIKTYNEDLDRLCAILKYREFAEENHLESQKALQVLTDKLAATTTVKNLTYLYRKVIRYSSDLGKLEIKPGDEEIQSLAKKLNANHKTEMDRIYNVLLDDKQQRSKIMNAFKEASEGIARFSRKIFVDPFKKDPAPPLPPAGNDNKPPAAQMEQVRKKGMKPKTL